MSTATTIRATPGTAFRDVLAELIHSRQLSTATSPGKSQNLETRVTKQSSCQAVPCNPSRAGLNQMDLDSIKQLIQSTMMTMILPEISLMQERLGIVKQGSLSKNCNDGYASQKASSHATSSSRLESSAASHRDSILTSVQSSDQLALRVDESKQGARAKELTIRTKTAGSVERTSTKREVLRACDVRPRSSDAQPLSPTASLRSWLARTEDARYKERLEELISEVEEEAVEGVMVTSQLVAPAGDSTDPALCKGRLGSEIQGPLDKDHGTSQGHLQTAIEAFPSTSAGQKSDNVYFSEPIPTTRPDLVLEKSGDEIQISAGTMFAPIGSHIASATQIRALTSQARVSVGQPTNHIDPSQAEGKFTIVVEALRKEMNTSLEDLKQKLKTIPELTERKVIAKLERPARTVSYGPRELPNRGGSCLTDYFKNGRAKKEQDRLEDLLSNLLQSVDGLKSEFRASRPRQSISDAPEMNSFGDATSTVPLEDKKEVESTVQFDEQTREGTGRPPSSSRNIAAETRPLSIPNKSWARPVATIPPRDAQILSKSETDQRHFIESARTGKIWNSITMRRPKGSRAMIPTREFADAIPKALSAAGRPQR